MSKDNPSTKFEKLNILFKSRVVKELTIEDLEMWEGFDRLNIGDIRFPESVEISGGNVYWYINRKKALKSTKECLKNIDKMIHEILQDRPLIYKRDSEVKQFIHNEQIKLEEHLIKLREIRNNRYKELQKMKEKK